MEVGLSCFEEGQSTANCNYWACSCVVRNKYSKHCPKKQASKCNHWGSINTEYELKLIQGYFWIKNSISALFTWVGPFPFCWLMKRDEACCTNTMIHQPVCQPWLHSSNHDSVPPYATKKINIKSMNYSIFVCWKSIYLLSNSGLNMLRERSP